MTEAPDDTLETIADLSINSAAEKFIDEIEDWPELDRCQITYMINVQGVDHLGEALDVAATSLIRYGMDSFYIVATDPDTGREWIIHNGEIVDPDELEARFQDLSEEDLSESVAEDEPPVAP